MISTATHPPTGPSAAGRPTADDTKGRRATSASATSPPQPDAGDPTRDRVAPTFLDVGVAVAAGAAAVVVSLTSREAGAHAPDAVAVALLATSAALLVARRRWPVGVLIVVTALTSLYLALDYPGGAELPLLMVVLYTAVAEGRRVAGLAFFAALLVVHAGFRLLVDREDPLLVVVTASLLVLVVALGEATRLRRELHREAQERLRAVEHEQAFEARAYLAAERLRLARELHDVLAHTITAITVQAGALADGLEPDSDAREALRSIRTTSREAMRQLEATISVLRADTTDGPEAGGLDVETPGVRDLPELTDHVQQTSGVHVHLEIGDGVAGLPAATGLIVYRLVQESLTNVIRHAAASHVEVVVERSDGELDVRIVDDGMGATATTTARSGFGLVGMRERVHALGGRFHAGPREDGGFAVEAALPLEEGAG